MAAASETTSRRQPKLSSSGSIMTAGADRRPGRDQQAEEDDADHDESVALAKRTGLSYHVTDRYVAISCNVYVPIGNTVKRVADAIGQKY